MTNGELLKYQLELELLEKQLSILDPTNNLEAQEMRRVKLRLDQIMFELERHQANIIKNKKEKKRAHLRLIK